MENTIINFVRDKQIISGGMVQRHDELIHILPLWIMVGTLHVYHEEVQIENCEEKVITIVLVQPSIRR